MRGRWWEKSGKLRKVIDTYWPWLLTFRATPMKRERKEMIAECWWNNPAHAISFIIFGKFILDFQKLFISNIRYCICLCFSNCNSCGSIFNCATKDSGSEKVFADLQFVEVFSVMAAPVHFHHLFMLLFCSPLRHSIGKSNTLTDNSKKN